MIRAAIYIRVSTEEQVLHGLSLEAQEETLREYAEKNEMKVVGMYADRGISARKKLNHRHEFQRLLQDVQENKIDIILVTKLDRWFRNIRDYHNTQAVLEQHHCNWKTVLEDYDTTTASGRLHINIMLSVNQDEADRTSERIKAVFKHKLEQGEVVSGSAPVGFKIENKKLVHNEDAEMVRDIYNHYEMHNSLRNTTIYISENYRNTFQETIKRILSDPIYKGTHKSGVEGFCEPIIQPDQWDRVQELLKINKRKYTQEGRKTDYIFTGFVFCKHCGSRLNGNRATSNGKRYPTYKCPKYIKSRTCDNKYTVSESVLEKKLLANIKPELERYKATFEVSKQEHKKNNKTAKIAKIKHKMGKLKDLYINDLITMDEYKNDYEEMKNQLDELEAQQEEKTVDIDAINAFLAQDIESIYKDLKPDEKRYLWLSVIDHIEIGHGRNDITIIFK